MVEPLFKKHFVATPAIDSIVELGAEEAKHAIAVRRMRVDEAIQLTNGLGLRVQGFITEVKAKSLMVRVTKVTEEPRPRLELTLIQALAKGDRDELSIQASTELGVMQVLPWQVICDEAAKQSLRVWHPQVKALVDSATLASGFGDFDQVFVLDPTAPTGLASQQSFAQRVAVVVGPEGGIDDSELALFEAAGAKRVSLGESILRTSTAGVVAISVIQAAQGTFD